MLIPLCTIALIAQLPQPDFIWDPPFPEFSGKTPLFANTPEPLPDDCHFSITAPLSSPYQIGGITDLSDPNHTESNMSYISSFAPNSSIDWIHNPSHRVCVELVELFTRNYPEHTVAAAKYLREKILAFHETYKDKPGFKYLQICHQRGSLDLYDALESLPEEVRQRVIVLAIAPTKVIPEELCYHAYNYRSRLDIIPYGAIVHAADLLSSGSVEGRDKALRHLQELVALTSHPLASGLDRDFQSPTFAETIDKHIQAYLKENGNYP